MKQTGHKKSTLFIGMARGGSSICSEIISTILSQDGYGIVDLEKDHYDNGIPVEHIDTSAYEELNDKKTYYGPFRSAPPNMRKARLPDVHKVIVVRDPRDCLVSHYFAMKNFHSNFKVGLNVNDMQIGREVSSDIDMHCLETANDYKLVLNGIVSFIYRHADAIVYRYEDIFSAPTAWIFDIATRLGLSLGDEAMKRAVMLANFETETEDESVHKRQGRPMDHLTKLKPATIESISRMLEPELSLLGYGIKPIQFASPATLSNNDTTTKELRAIKGAIAELATENGYRIDEISDNREKLAKLEMRYEKK